MPSALSIRPQLYIPPFLICVVVVLQPPVPLPSFHLRFLGHGPPLTPLSPLPRYGHADSTMHVATDFERRQIFQSTKTTPSDIAGIVDGSNGDGGKSLTPTRTPSPSGGQQPASVSPAIPAVLVICCLAAVLSFCWWFRRRLRRSRRYVPLLARLGLGAKPQLVEARVQSPRVLGAQADGCWGSLSPLALMKLPSERSQGRRHALPPPSHPLGKRQTSHRPAGQTTEPGDRRPRRTTRPSKSDSPAVIQVAVFIAMPSPDLHSNKRGSPAFATDCGLPALHVGVANVRCTGR